MQTQNVATGRYQTCSPREVATLFETWLPTASLLEQQAIVATRAHPRLLAEDERVSRVLVVYYSVLSHLAALDRAARGSEGLRVLRKGIQYATSVLAAASPGAGFDFMGRWARGDDPGIRSIMRADLRRARLAKAYPQQVARTLEIL